MCADLQDGEKPPGEGRSSIAIAMAQAVLGVPQGQWPGWGHSQASGEAQPNTRVHCSSAQEEVGFAVRAWGATHTINKKCTINLKGWEQRRKGQKSQTEHELTQGSTGNRTWDPSCCGLLPAKAAKPGAPSQGCESQEVQPSPVCCCAAPARTH